MAERLYLSSFSISQKSSPVFTLVTISVNFIISMEYSNDRRKGGSDIQEWIFHHAKCGRTHFRVATFAFNGNLNLCSQCPEWEQEGLLTWHIQTPAKLGALHLPSYSTAATACYPRSLLELFIVSVA